MSDFIGFAEVTGAILMGLGLAMSLEWLALNGLLHFMPASHKNNDAQLSGHQPHAKY